MSRRTTHPADLDLEWSPLNRPPQSTVAHARGTLLDWSSHPRRVCLYGASLGKELAPLDDPDCVVWGLNLVLPRDSRGRVRADAWWDMHQRKAQSDDDMRWLRALPMPVYVPGDLLCVGPHAVRYPIELVEDTFRLSYWTCTFAYQIALAVLSGFREITLAGIELSVGTERERTVEWACTSFWLGLATASGVRVVVPGNSLLCRHPARYGLEYDAEKSAVELYLADRERASVDA